VKTFKYLFCIAYECIYYEILELLFRESCYCTNSNVNVGSAIQNEGGCYRECMSAIESIFLAQDMDQWWAQVNTIMDFQVSRSVGNY
jgi:hypothetical protein